ncbi:glutathione S-transferase family protein [Engelhardtia mirabilis]|uniref:GST C-terminal domain-containing protein n=1 Tax=Engelhardtia mirabilis TaxID=2528011 RepID=A0A518BHC8_9BACT|nr:hypothetical protein Pla133_14600 [Planctomycetes bacterium Pla133]QDV00715.1 hypothetical protein Pla86_14590 [Planctomycetes bacterium Pla86]
MRRLITIPISHYCEKARWALDRAGVDYVEDAHLPALSARLTRKAGGKATTPVLVAPEGVLSDSADIVRYADERAPADLRLLPTDGAERRVQESLEAELNDVFGPHARRLAYSFVLDTPALLVECTRGRVPAFEHLLFRTLRPVFLGVLVRYLKITEEGAERSRGTVLELLDRTDALLADGRPNLFGERFGIADLTFAALAAPLVLPPEHPGGMPPVERCSPRLQAFVSEMRARPSGRWILAAYESR